MILLCAVKEEEEEEGPHCAALQLHKGATAKRGSFKPVECSGIRVNCSLRPGECLEFLRHLAPGK